MSQRNTIEFNAGPLVPIVRIEREFSYDDGSWIIRTFHGRRLIQETLADTPEDSLAALQADAHSALTVLLDLLGAPQRKTS